MKNVYDKMSNFTFRKEDVVHSCSAVNERCVFFNKAYLVNLYKTEFVDPWDG